MEAKTIVDVLDGRQDVRIRRDFDLPVDLLYKAYVIPEIVEEWMGTKVLKLIHENHGSYQFETTDPRGMKHGFSGCIHECVENEKITRTFEMENAPYSVQLEFLEFEAVDEEHSTLRMHIVYKSVEHRDQMLQLGVARGMNMAHNRLEKAVQSFRQRS